MPKSPYTIFCRWCGASGVRRFGRDRSGRQRFHCPHCGRTFSRRTRTARSGSRLSDPQWTFALKLFCTRAGVCAEDLSDLLSVNRKTAQRLLRALRVLVAGLAPRHLPGPSEWDESLPLKDQWVLGGYSREIRQCVLQIIPKRSEDVLIPAVEAVTDGQSPIFTDEWGGYLRLMNHWTVNHSKGFINRDARFVHTNGVEGIWGHLKPLGYHVYRGFKRRTLSEFLAEFMFRYNFRAYEARKRVLSALLSRKSINTLLV